MRKFFASIVFFLFIANSQFLYSQCTTVTDNNSPDVPVLDSISVNETTGNVFLAWQPSDSLDTKGYVVYQLTNGVWLSVATISGINSTSYTYVPNSVDAGLDFRIAAFDSCNNISPQGTIHKTIFAKVKQDKCLKTNTISWNKYEGWSGIGKYQIYVSINSGPFSMLGELSSATNTFVHKNIEPLGVYCYFVRAFDNSLTKSSLSHKLCFTANVYKVPDFIYLVTATVETERVKIIAHCDKTADLKHYLVQRSISNASAFKTIDTLSPSYTVNELTYYDSTAQTESNFYYYKLVAIDSCGINVKSSENNVCTMLLSVDANFNLKNNLDWNNFEQWSNGTKRYKLYRGEFNTESSLQSFAFSDTSLFVDNVENAIINSGNYCYQVEALENDTNVYEYSGSSKSNVFCLKQIPSIYIPNAFHPGEEYNPIFKPVGLFFTNESFKMEIFNRWGQRVFETNDPLIGWNGEDAELGIYIYKIQYADTDKKIHILTGSLTLLR